MMMIVFPLSAIFVGFFLTPLDHFQEPMSSLSITFMTDVDH
jgi:hypothetical protein